MASNTLLSAGALALPLVFASTTHAQSLTSRLSTLSYSTIYGGGADVIVGSDSESWTTLDATDLKILPFYGAHAGNILENPKRPFSATVDISAAHQYSVTGPLSAFRRLRAAGQTNVVVSVGGEGAAQMSSLSPGNLLEMHFTLSETTPARFAGEVAFTSASFSGSSVTLQRFDGFAWVYVFWSSSELPGGVGTFDRSLDLVAGEYRIIAEATVNAVLPGGSPAQDNRWAYDLFICEPADLNCNGNVGGADLALLLAAWGSCSGCREDIDGDGTVGAGDLALLLASWN